MSRMSLTPRAKVTRAKLPFAPVRYGRLVESLMPKATYTGSAIECMQDQGQDSCEEGVVKEAATTAASGVGSGVGSAVSVGTSAERVMDLMAELMAGRTPRLETIMAVRQALMQDKQMHRVRGTGVVGCRALEFWRPPWRPPWFHCLDLVCVCVYMCVCVHACM